MSKKAVKNITICIDPGEKAGVAIFLDKELYKAFPMNGSSPKDMHKTMLKLNKELKEKHPAVTITALIEDGFVGVNPKASSLLSMRRGFFYFICAMFGYDIDMRMPAYWQSRTFRIIEDDLKLLSRTKKLTTKDKSAVFVNKYYVDMAATHDVADAICMGHAYLNDEEE